MINKPKKRRVDLHIIAKEANAWARSHILYSTTHPPKHDDDDETEDMRDAQQVALATSLSDLREINKAATKILYGEKKGSKLNALKFLVTTISKYSLGNCFEYSILALYYITLTHPHVQVELIDIDPGDHTCLVLERDARSDESDPLSWHDALICDPWDDKFYPAHDYLTKLKVLNPKYVEGLHGDYFCYTTIDFIPALCKINIEKHISASILHHEKKTPLISQHLLTPFFHKNLSQHSYRLK